MPLEEIFSYIIAHMIEGLMVHDQLSNMYNFLGLEGYKAKHEYHYYCENKNYRELTKYFIEHYNKLVADRPFKNPNIIPESWKQFNRFQVDESTRQSYIKYGIDKWVDWEKETKILYQECYQKLMQIGEISAALRISEYIIDVDEELAEAEADSLFCSGLNYNVNDILLEQQKEYKKYQKKIKGEYIR